MARDQRPAIARLDGPSSTPDIGVSHVGFGICRVPGCRCGLAPHPWSYTVGLAAFGLPELVIMCGQLQINDAILYGLAERLRLGPPVEPGRDVFVDGPHTFPVRIIDLPQTWITHDPGRMGKWFGWNERRHGILPDLRQVLWPDPCWRFPGHAEYAGAVQPVLADDPVSFPRPGNREERRAARRLWAA